MTTYNWQQRTAYVGGINIISIASSATMQIGDRKSTRARLRALAVQEQRTQNPPTEFYFKDYPLFDYELPDLDKLLPPNDVQMKRMLRNNTIHVGRLDILAISTAASIIVGNGESCHTDSRVKHFRKFNPNFFPHTVQTSTSTTY